MQDEMKKLIINIKDRGKPTAMYEEMLNKVTLMQAEIVTEHLGVDASPFMDQMKRLQGNI